MLRMLMWNHWCLHYVCLTRILQTETKIGKRNKRRAIMVLIVTLCLFRVWKTGLGWRYAYRPDASFCANCVRSQLQTSLRFIYPWLHGLRWVKGGWKGFLSGRLWGTYGLWTKRKILPWGCCVMGSWLCQSRKIWRLF